jgi:hypothetical protein
MPQSDEMDGLAQRVRDALEAADLDAYGELLDPKVTWGAPGGAKPACRNRDQVLAWYMRGREAGTRASVGEVTWAGRRILVGLMVTGSLGPEDQGGQAERWQVLTTRDGLIVDIVGYDNRREAAALAGLT